MRSGSEVEQHRKAILDALANDGAVNVDALSEAFGVSAVTIRKDLAVLQNQGLVKRTYGGAELIVPSNERGQIIYEPSFNQRKQHAQTEKSAIAQRAVQLIQSGDSVVLDSSTTVFAMLPFLKKIQSLTVYTNSVAVANNLIDQPRIHVIMPGGRLRRDSLALIGELNNLEINLTWGFFGARGLDAQMGISDVHRDESALKRQLVLKCRRSVILADSSKWGLIAPYTFASPDQLHSIITTTQAAAEHLTAMRERGVEVIAASLPNLRYDQG